jgi:hypothetical protein
MFRESSDEDLKYRVAGLLLHLYRSDSQQFLPDLRSKVQQIAEEIVRAEYPGTPLGRRSFALLHLANKARAEELLLSQADPVHLTGQELHSYISDLQFLRTPGTIKKLAELEAVGGEIGKLAHQSLGNIGKLSPAQLQALARQFRMERTTALLYKLFYVYLRFQIGKPVQPVRELLGEPTRVGVNVEGIDSLFYQTENPGGEVQILFNKDGNIIDTVVDD